MNADFMFTCLLATLLATACMKDSHEPGVTGAAIPEIAQAPLGEGKELRISEAQAIQFAEAFVAGNGYTDLPPKNEGINLSRESIDDDDPGARASSRRNTLLRSACGVFPERIIPSAPGWTVVFCYNPDNERYKEQMPDFVERSKHSGRGVVMNPDGSGLRMLHPDVGLNFKGLVRLPRTVQ